MGFGGPYGALEDETIVFVAAIDAIDGRPGLRLL
jgi:hypothetical protein